VLVGCHQAPGKLPEEAVAPVWNYLHDLQQIIFQECLQQRISKFMSLVKGMSFVVA
jgi:hypothetical protein